MSNQKIPITFEDFADLAETMMAKIPEPFLTGLNGGINVLPDTMEDNEGLVILGECYWDDYLGHWIHLYYGSFCELFADEPNEVWKEELWETILHEIEHHLENMAGIDDLARRELAELEQWRQERDGKD